MIKLSGKMSLGVKIRKNNKKRMKRGGGKGRCHLVLDHQFYFVLHSFFSLFSFLFSFLSQFKPFNFCEPLSQLFLHLIDLL